MHFGELKIVLDSMKKSLSKLDKWEVDYKESPHYYNRYLEQSFISFINVHYELIVIYFRLYDNNNENSDSLELKLDMESTDLSKELKLFLYGLQGVTNGVARDSIFVPFKEVYEFYLNNKNNFKLLYEVLLEKYNKGAERFE